MNDIPDWAGKRACELLNAEAQISEWRWPRDHESPSVVTVAKLVMQHEQPPADPDEEAVKRIFAKGWDSADPELYWSAHPERLAAAVSQYKQERSK